MPILSRVVAGSLVAGALGLAACSDDASSGTNGTPEGGSAQGGSAGKGNAGGASNKAGNGGTMASAGTTAAGKGGNEGGAGGGEGGNGAEPGLGGQAGAGVDQGGQAGEGGSLGLGGDGLGGDAMGGAGGADLGPVSSVIKKSITKQLSPLDLNDPYVIEVGTSGFFPVTLTNPQVVLPEGWTLSRVEEVPGNCPYISNGQQRCLQFFRVYMYSDSGVCSLSADQIQWSWDVECGAGGDCARMPPDLTVASFTTTHNSENFCEQEIDVDPFRPQSAFFMPSLGNAPTTIRIFTTLEHPYTFSPGEVTLPPGFTLAGFSEDVAKRVCDTVDFPDKCRQWWNLDITPSGACKVAGQYQVIWNVGCDVGGNCDPRVTTYTHNQKLTETRNLCAN